MLAAGLLEKFLTASRGTLSAMMNKRRESRDQLDLIRLELCSPSERKERGMANQIASDWMCALLPWMVVGTEAAERSGHLRGSATANSQLIPSFVKDLPAE